MRHPELQCGHISKATTVKHIRHLDTSWDHDANYFVETSLLVCSGTSGGERLGKTHFGEFGIQLYIHRQAAGLSQEELAIRSGLTARTISNLERGATRAPHPNSVRRIADALHLGSEERAEFIVVGARKRLSNAKSVIDTSLSGAMSAHQVGLVLPRQLPAPVHTFIGRDAELKTLTGALDSPGDPVPSSPVILTIEGAAGVGKTALAVQWAYQVVDRFPDGQLYVNLRGHEQGQPVSSSEALARFLRAFGLSGPTIPADGEERAATYRSMLAARRMLIVLDNASTTEQVQLLVPGSRSCVMVTSRNALTRLMVQDGAARMVLNSLSVEEAVLLLRKRIGPRVAADPLAATKLAAVCRQMPSTLRVVAELAVTRPEVPLIELARKLADLQHRMECQDIGDHGRGVAPLALDRVYWDLDEVVAAPHNLAALPAVGHGHSKIIMSPKMVAGRSMERAVHQVASVIMPDCKVAEGCHRAWPGPGPDPGLVLLVQGFTDLPRGRAHSGLDPISAVTQLRGCC